MGKANSGDWKGCFKEGKEIVLSTCSSDARPNANIVISLGFQNGKLLIADCQMNTTIKNIIANHRVCIIGGCYRIKGSASVFSSGKYLDISKAENREFGSYKVRNAILITINEVFDLDKLRIIWQSR